MTIYEPSKFRYAISQVDIYYRMDMAPSARVQNGTKNGMRAGVGVTTQYFSTVVGLGPLANTENERVRREGQGMGAEEYSKVPRSLVSLAAE